MQRHEIPTHLNVEDRAFLGLTVRQLLTAAVGLALAYGAVSDLPAPLTIRLVIGVLVLFGSAALALWRPACRPVEDWGFVLLRYWLTPRVAVWRPGERSDDLVAARYEVVVPSPAPHRNERLQGKRGQSHVAAF